MTAAERATNVEDRRMDRDGAAAWTKLTVEALGAGKVSVQFGEESVSRLQGDGFYDLADAVRAAVKARTDLLRSRGFRFGGVR